MHSTSLEIAQGRTRKRRDRVRRICVALHEICGQIVLLGTADTGTTIKNKSATISETPSAYDV